MKIAIIGAGNVGGTLGTAWAQKAGHDIFFGVRDAKSEKTQALLSKIGGKTRAGTPAEAAAFGDFIVLTTPWPQAEAAIRSLGDVDGRIILDATNPLAMGPMASAWKSATAPPQARRCRAGPRVPRCSRRSTLRALATWPIPFSTA
jgi:predicted dinucleotide-binding enzyme